jgi:HSP20 family protein
MESPTRVIISQNYSTYHRVIEIPPEADTETVKSAYKNGILEIVFKKKEHTKPKGKEVKVE